MTIERWRKKPVEIETLLYRSYDLDRDDVRQWVDTEIDEIGTNDHPGLHIKTLEGWMHVSDGDYIIKGVKGEFYPCKPDIFEMSYTRIE